MTPASSSSVSSSPLLEVENLTETLRALVDINSVNPGFGGPEGGEAEVIRWVAAFLRDRGIGSEVRDALPGRPNLTARLPGRDRSRTLLVQTHVDTVSTAGMTVDPHAAELRDGRLWGRGATDAKGQVAALLHAFAALAESPEPPPINIELLLCVDEENGFGGSIAWVAALPERDVSAHGRIVGAVVGEPTNLDVVSAHKGSHRWWIETKGRAAHSAMPHLGVNAIRHASALVELIESDYAAELKSRRHPLIGSPTINVSMIEGGTQVNMVPARARVLLDRRTLPGETVESVRAELDRVIARAREKFPDLNARQEPPLLVDPSLETPTGDPLVRAALAVARDFGASPEPRGVPYCTDGSKIAEAGIPTIVAGPGSIEQAHTADEWIDLRELQRGARFFHRLMREFAAE